MSDPEVWASLSMIALVGGGVRAAIIWWALSRDEAQPRNRSRRLALVMTVIAAAGAVGLVVTWAATRA